MHVCSWYWSKERVQFFSMALSDHTSHNQCFKSQELGYEVSALSTISTHQQNAISSNILITFCREKNFYKQQDRENSFQELLNPEALDF